MSAVPFTYQTFETARMQLVGRIHELLNGKDKVLLLSFNSGEQDGGVVSRCLVQGNRLPVGVLH